MKTIVLSTLLASTLLTGALQAKKTASKDATVKEVNKIAMSNAKSDAKDQEDKLVVEAINSIKEAHEAYVALANKDITLATKKLEAALGKLEVILSAKDAPKLLPIDSIVAVHEYIGSSKDIDVALEAVTALLGQHKVQEARLMMIPLQSEIDITTVSLPLASYPDALKLAAKYVHDNQLEKAQSILGVALSSFAQITEIIPIPLLKATDLIAASSAIAIEDKTRALSYLDGASESLKVAHKLGYVSKSTTTYKMLEEQIDGIKKEINGPNKAEKLFETLKASLKEFKEKIFSENNEK